MAVATDLNASVEQGEVLLACLHGVDEHLIPAVSGQHDHLQDATVRVEPEAELAMRVVT